MIQWAAGSFDSTYPLDETPSWTGSAFQDTGIVESCVAR